MVQGFTTLEIDDLPCETPSRSLCDNLWQKYSAATNADREKAFGCPTSDRVTAHKDAQLGKTAGSCEATEEGVVEMDADD